MCLLWKASNDRCGAPINAHPGYQHSGEYGSGDAVGGISPARLGAANRGELTFYCISFSMLY